MSAPPPPDPNDPNAPKQFGTLSVARGHREPGRVRELADAALNAEGHLALLVLDGLEGPARDEALAIHKAIRAQVLALAALRGVTP